MFAFKHELWSSKCHHVNRNYFRYCMEQVLPYPRQLISGQTNIPPATSEEKQVWLRHFGERSPIVTGRIPENPQRTHDTADRIRFTSWTCCRGSAKATRLVKPAESAEWKVQHKRLSVPGWAKRNGSGRWRTKTHNRGFVPVGNPVSWASTATPCIGFSQSRCFMLVGIKQNERFVCLFCLPPPSPSVNTRQLRSQSVTLLRKQIFFSCPRWRAPRRPTPCGSDRGQTNTSPRLDQLAGPGGRRAGVV